MLELTENEGFAASWAPDDKNRGIVRIGEGDKRRLHRIGRQAVLFGQHLSPLIWPDSMSTTQPGEFH
jgi:hypothetical protein